MKKTKLHDLAEFGQSIWLDYINRDMIETGKLKEWIGNGLRGMTSNPSIFNQVISAGTDYDSRIVQLKEAGHRAFEIYDALTISDIQDACDIFKPVYDKTHRLDGYVSLEINPKLASATKASIDEGKRLFEKVKRPNCMIKVPATPEGFPVITELIGSGINVNVTLIFSLDQYEETVEAYLKGIEQCYVRNGDLSKIRSVASVFVSRIDTTIDQMLDEKFKKTTDPKFQQQLKSLKGKAAVANCRVILGKAREFFTSERFYKLQKNGTQEQRVLWGSTSTKNPEYSDVKYVEELIARSTVNTVPENTLKVFLEHGKITSSMELKIKEDLALFKVLKQQGVDINSVCKKLLEEGVVAFEKAFDALLNSIEVKAQKLVTH